MTTPTPQDLEELVRRIENEVATNPDAMRVIADQAFEIGFTLMATGEDAAVHMLVDAGIPEELARREVRDIVARAINR